jgi:hypothetical protein
MFFLKMAEHVSQISSLCLSLILKNRRPPAKHIVLFIDNVKAGNISRIPSKATALK